MSTAPSPERDLRSYLLHSVAATTTVLAVPAAILWLSTQLVYIRIPFALTALVAVAFMAVGVAVGSKLWEGTAAAEEISFSELMLWSWYRLAQADERLAEFRLRAAEVDASPEHQLAVLQELSDALEAKDPYTRGHSARVERHAFKTAAAMGLSLKEIDVLRKAASLHDVGKMRIPNRVLHKNGPLDEEERALIEEHPVLGSWMVATIGDEQIVATIRHHHERWDGRGYPDGISGNEIPLFARIIAVADTFDAITSTRSYRAGSSRQRAIDILKAESGRQFDPQVVDAFLTTLPDRSAALASLLVFAPDLLWGRLVQWLRRFGDGALAPGLGAVGAAIVLGTSTFLASPVPETPRDGGSRGDAGSTTVADFSGTPTAAGATDDGGKTKVLGTRIERAKAATRDDKDRRSVERQRRASKPSDRRRTGTGGGDADLAPGQAQVVAVKDEPEAVPSPAPVPADPAPVNDTLEEIQDPKARKGQDCVAGLGSKSKGSQLHCQ